MERIGSAVRAWGIFLLLAVAALPGCVGSRGLVPSGETPQREILQSPRIDHLADQINQAAHAAILSRNAPNAEQQWLIPPAVSGSGNWEASALCFALALRNGRLRPLQPPRRLDTAAAIQAWLRSNSSRAVVWMVESNGLFEPDLNLMICTANRLWRSEPFKVSVAKKLQYTWPLDAKENPPLASLKLGASRALVRLNGTVFLDSGQALQELQWRKGSLQLKPESSRPLVTLRENERRMLARALAQDLSPPLLLMQRDLRLVLGNADLPAGEGDLEQWSLSRGGDGMRLPLAEASETQILSITAAPENWNLADTWLVLRGNPDGSSVLQLFAAVVRVLPEAPSRGHSRRMETVRVASDFAWPLLVDEFGEDLTLTHELHFNPDHRAHAWDEFAEFEARASVFAPLSFWTLSWRLLPELRLRQLDPAMHVIRFSPLAKEYPEWLASVAKKPLVFGDTARWKVVPAAPVWGIARLSPAMPLRRRRVVAAWLRSLGPFELFGLSREGLEPRLPLSGRERSPRPEAEDSLKGQQLQFSFLGCPGIVDRLPDALSEELRERLGFLARDRGAQTSTRVLVNGEPEDGPTKMQSDCVLDGGDQVDFGRLILPVGTMREKAMSLLRACGMLESWRKDTQERAQELNALSDERLAGEVEDWLFEQAVFVPLWTEEGRVFVDRRVAGLRADPQSFLPDLSTAHLLPKEQMERFGWKP